MLFTSAAAQCGSRVIDCGSRFAHELLCYFVSLLGCLCFECFDLLLVAFVGFLVFFGTCGFFGDFWVYGLGC